MSCRIASALDDAAAHDDHRELLDRYDGVLLDAYGVLDRRARRRCPAPASCSPSSSAAARRTRSSPTTRRASPATYARRFAGIGLAVPRRAVRHLGQPARPATSPRGLAGARTCVLGTADSRAYVAQGGGVVVPLAPSIEIDALAVCDDDGFDVPRPASRARCPRSIRAVEAGRRPALVLPNPDLVYPKGGGELGFTAGAMALLIEAALARRFPARGLRVRCTSASPSRTCSPRPRAGSALAPDRLVMIGDQLETDIAGARAAGVATALLAGVSRWEHAQTPRRLRRRGCSIRCGHDPALLLRQAPRRRGRTPRRARREAARRAASRPAPMRSSGCRPTTAPRAGTSRS